MNVKKFINHWSSRGYEKGDTHAFWLSLLRDVFNIDEPEEFISFEVPIPHGFIDGLIVSTKTLIEQKSSNVNLDDEEIFNQAKRYNDALEYSRKARWIITCNFKEFHVFDMDKKYPERDPIKIFLYELPKRFNVLNFIVEQQNISYERELSVKASAIVAKIYDGLRAELKIQSDKALSDLNKLCVRLVFCLYAESIDIFGKHKIFRDYLRGARNIRQDLLELFKVLDTPLENRSPYLDDTLKKFPYVDGGLFADEIDFPNFTTELKTLLLDEASGNFDWAQISPTIFGTVFESTLNHDVRRAGGMHYTSIENIHKVIDPLFLDDLNAQLTKFSIANSVNQTSKSTSKSVPAEKTASRRDTKFSIANFVNHTSKRRNFLLNLQKKLSEIKILDPACGSGNFLTESYISLRRLENKILQELLGNQITLGELDNPVKVSINQFFGIEINNFAVTVAQTALWIAELKMKRETEAIVHKNLELFPLKTYPNIIQANALHVEWEKTDYIISNPPFVGASMMNHEQKADAVNIFGKIKLSNSIDYVGAWYHKAAKLIQGTNIRAAFVSTNSITQGEQVTPLWQKIFDFYGMQIIFGRRTFKWDSESFQKAAIHCVVIGIADKSVAFDKKIFDGEKIYSAHNINPYLVDAPTIFIERRAKHIQPFVLRIIKGNMPIDDGNLLLTADERKKILQHEPKLEKFIFRYVGGYEFINNVERYCLWLINATPDEIRRSKELYRRVSAVREFRLASKRAETRNAAVTSHLFDEIRQPTTNYLCIPQVSSEKRRYIPIGFMPPEIIASSQLILVPSAQIYEFGIITSSIHMSWMRAVAGRLKSDYRYSGSVVYNNFAWVEASLSEKALIEATAAEILSVRAKYPRATLADLYDELTMPPDLRQAHRKNDLAVAKAYGFEEILDSEPSIVAELMKRYESLTKR
ncbi:MAG: N-6 DNA methylase [Selenomonadaceae bacterium]|nr:N-6 DNA methylase [Selenomonadaceae bacterium]